MKRSYEETDKLISLSYPAGAGGKFVSNCLALSSDVFALVPKQSRRDVFLPMIISRVAAEIGAETLDDVTDVLGELGLVVHQTKTKQLQLHIESWSLVVLNFFRRYGDLQTRLDWIKLSLPNSTESLSKWMEFEFCAEQTYGFHFNELFRRYQVDRSIFEHHFFNMLQEAKLFHFMVFHTEQNSRIIHQYFPNIQQIRFVNSSNWVRHCLRSGKRWNQCDERPVIDLPPSHLNFDVESIFSKQAFLDEIKKLYAHFSLSNFNSDAINEFHELYLQNHSIKL
jgi:hypothetical protein